MRIAGLIGIAVLAGTLHANDRLVVYVHNEGVFRYDVLWHAEMIAGGMFANIGVSVDWQGGTPPRMPVAAGACSPRFVRVTLVRRLPDEVSPGRLGWAEIPTHLPGRAFVPADRLDHAVPPEWVPFVLAHVLAHEITHVVEGGGRHSETGVMKACWSYPDYRRMVSGTLGFTATDASIIHTHLAESCEAVQFRSRHFHVLRVAARPCVLHQRP